MREYQDVSLDRIVISDRCRADIGDLESLMTSIQEIGLLHPVVLTSDYRLVAGERRYRAFQRLGRSSIAAHVCPALDEALKLAEAERDENTCREPLSPSEALAQSRKLEKLYEEEAAQRRQEGNRAGGKAAGRGRPKDRSRETFPQPKEGSRTKARSASGTGYSYKTLAKVEEIERAAEKDPETFGPLAESLKKKGCRPDGVHKQYKRLKAAKLLDSQPVPTPDGPFDVLVIDPPWTYNKRKGDTTHRANLSYPSMTVEEIKALSIPAHENCLLWLWTTNAHIFEAGQILEAWGFQSKTVLTWVKDRMGTGDWLRGQTEHCILAIKGKPAIKKLTNQSTVLYAKRGEHSRKPEEFYELVESLCPGSKCEMFSRQPRKGWNQHGDSRGVRIRNL